MLTGRYIEIKILLLSFKEYMSGFEDKTYYYQVILTTREGKTGNTPILEIELAPLKKIDNNNGTDRTELIYHLNRNFVAKIPKKY